jgi:hypothetical protein
MVAFYTFLLLSLPFSTAFAGGDDTTVHVLKVVLLSDTDYLMVVSPVEKNDSVTLGCHRFEVHGTFGRLDGIPILQAFSYRSGLKKASHIAALRYLKKYEGSNKTVRFGYMGEGYRPLSPKNKCIVDSRALQLEDGAVLSYFHVV